MSNPVSFYRINSIRSCVTGAAPARGAAYLHEIKSVALHFRFITSDFLRNILCWCVPRFDFISALL